MKPLTNRPYNRERSVATVIYVALLLLSLVPGTSLLAVWLIPAPLVVFHVTRLRSVAVVLAAVYTACLLVAGLNAAALVMGAGVYFFSWVMADAMLESESPYPALVTGTLVFVMLELVLLAFYHWSGGNLYADLKHAIGLSIAQDHALFATNVATATQGADSFLTWLQGTLPGVLCVFAFLAAALNQFIARAVLSHTGEKQPLLLEWRLPGAVIGVYVVAVAVVLFGWFHSIPLLWQGVNSALMVAGFLLGIQGLALVWRRIYQHRLAKLWLTLMVVGGLIQVARSVYVLLGLIDMVRRPRRT